MAALSSGASLAQGPTPGTPRTISFQGVLTDATGTFVADGNHSLTLRIYDAATGGNELYTETQQVLVVRGLFNTLVGSSQVTGLPQDLRFDRAYFIGITVDGGTELSPRTAMSAVPYAFSATLADSAGRSGHAVIADRAIAAETATRIAGGAVTSVNGQQGAINIVGGNGTTVTSNGSSLVISSVRGGDTSAIRHLRSGDRTMTITDAFGPSAMIDVAHGGIRTEHVVDGAIITPKILDGAVTSSKLAGSVITTDKIENLAVTTGKLAGDAVTSAKIADGAVQTADLQNNAVTAAKISATGSVAGQTLISDGSGTPVWGTPVVGGPAGGDLAGTYPNPTVAPTAGNNLVDALNNAATTGAIDYSKLDLAGRIASGDIATDAVGSSNLADGSVTNPKIADGSVTNPKIADDAVTTSKVVDAAVTTPKIADSAVTGAKILSGAIGVDHIADGSITDAKVASGISYSKLSGAPTSLPPSGTAAGDLAGSYPNPTIAATAGSSIITAVNDAATAGAIDYSKLNLAGSISNGDISPTAAIDYSKLALTGSIMTADLADGSVTDAKVANGISYAKLTGAPTSLPPDGAAGGDLAGSYPNPTIANDAITAAKIAEGAVTLTKMSTTGAAAGQVITYDGANVVWGAGGASGAAGGDLAGSYPNPTIASDAIDAANIADGTITNAEIAPAAGIAYSKLALTNSIVNGDITPNAITTSKVANGTVTTSKMADSAISGLKLLTYAVTSRHLAAGAVSTDKIDPTGATTGQVLGFNGTNVAWTTPAAATIADSSISSRHISASAAIPYSKLVLSNSIANGDLTVNSVTTSKVANGTVTTSKLADSAVSGLKLLTNAVTNRHLADGSVTAPKLSAAGSTAGQVLISNGFTVTWITPTANGLAMNRAAITSANSPYNIAVNADFIGVNQTTPITVTLPPANMVPAGKVIIVNAEQGTYSAANLLTIAVVAGNTVNGAGSITTNALYLTRRFYSDGVSAWYTF